MFNNPDTACSDCEICAVLAKRVLAVCKIVLDFGVSPFTRDLVDSLQAAKSSMNMSPVVLAQRCTCRKASSFHLLGSWDAAKSAKHRSDRAARDKTLPFRYQPRLRGLRLAVACAASVVVSGVPLLESEYQGRSQLLYDDLMLGLKSLRRIEPRMLKDGVNVDTVCWNFAQHIRLEEASVRACVPRLHVANWRKITVAIVRTKFASQIECFGTDDGDEDAEEMEPII